MLINKHTKAASTIYWTSNKIERKIKSKMEAEAIAMQKMFDMLLFTKRVLTELCGKGVSYLQCVWHSQATNSCFQRFIDMQRMTEKTRTYLS